MFWYFKSLVVVTLGVALGFVATYFAVDRGVGFGVIVAGPWRVSPKTGSREADPYARAARARSAETPLGVTEGLTFLARTDSMGAQLEPRCDYVVAGPTPQARFWTIWASTPEGQPINTGTGVFGFTSSEVVRDSAGGFEIVVAPRARPGNWLPVERNKPYLLVFRLYDTTASVSANALDANALPRIDRGRCA